MKKDFVATLILLMASLLLAAFAYAQVPHLLNYQGRLTDSGGVPVADGSYTITFRLYNVEEGGDILWTETQSVITTDGLFSAILGDTSPLDSLDFNQGYWLTIQIGADQEMSPRQRITAAEYSLNADRLDGMDSANFALTSHDHHDSYYAKSELNTSDGDVPNAGSNRVHWNNLTGVPDGFADGIDDLGSGGGGGDITSVTAGSGLTGGGDTGGVTLHVGAGTGIQVQADAVSLTSSYQDGSVYDSRFVNEGDTGSGSGLNADLLDGEEGIYYTNWNNLTNVPTGFADNTDDTGITDHGALTGLGDDDHPQYLLTNGTRAMSGSLNMNNNSITSLNQLNGGIPWTSANHGPGSTLDADLLDGQHASDFVSTTNDWGRYNVTADLYEGTARLTDRYVNEGQANSITSAMITNAEIVNADISAAAAIDPSKISGTAWTSTNDGTGSTLDADLLDGQNSSAFLSTSNDYGRSGVTTNLYEGTTTLTDKYVNEGQANSVTAAMIAPDIVSSLDGVSNDGGNIDLVAGSNITITPDDVNNQITIAAAGCTGDITTVNAGSGLTGGGTSGDVTVNVGAGTGIEVTADAVSLASNYQDGSAYDSRFVNEGQANSISTGMISPNILSSLDGVSNDGGNIGLVAGSNITITPDDANNQITIAAAGGGSGDGHSLDAADGSPTDAVYVDNAGNVGIGLTNPGEPLTIQGNSESVALSIVGRSADDIGSIIFEENDGTTRLASIGAYAGGKLTIEDTTKFIVENGNVGIGTMSPGNILAINSAATVPSYTHYTVAGANPGDVGVVGVNTNFFTNSLAGDMVVRAADNTRLLLGVDSVGNQAAAMAILESSNIGIGTATPGNILTIVQSSSTDPIADAWTTYSSKRWKTNIKPIESALDKVKRLRGVYFDWKADGKHDMGMIAEEVGEVIPEVVAYEENGVDAKSVDYARLVAVLVEAIKEQQSEIETLKQRIEVLENR